MMRDSCREPAGRSWHRLQLMSKLLHRARIVSDPKRLAQLYAEAEKWKCYARDERIQAERR
jgi:hypothetical protein